MLTRLVHLNQSPCKALSLVVEDHWRSWVAVPHPAQLQSVSWLLIVVSHGPVQADPPPSH